MSDHIPFEIQSEIIKNLPVKSLLQFRGTPFKSYDFSWDHVSIDGIIYWHTVRFDERLWSNYIISFNLKTEKFGEVSLSERLARAYNLVVSKVNESLCLLEYYNEGSRVNSVFYRLLGFRNNGEVVLEMEDVNDKGYAVELYEPSSGHISGVGMNGNATFSAMSYMETLILLHESNSIIH
ncbi:hypothetical protein Tco_1216125 [Tanacetum coccineum]